MGNGFVWTVSVVDGNIRCEAVGDIALTLDLCAQIFMVFLKWYETLFHTL